MADLVVITDCDHPDVDIERSAFAAAGLDVRLASCRTEADVVRAGARACALLVQYAPVSAAVLSGLPRCQVVGRYGTGLDPIDVQAAQDRGLDVVSVPDYSTQEVSDHAIALVMALCRGLVPAVGAVRTGRWTLADAGPVRRLGSLRLGVVGLGRIGRAVARKAAALGFDVVGCDVAPPPASPVRLLSLEDVLGCSDIVSLHVPLSAQTRHLIDASRLALMRPTAFLVNTSRGGLVDQAALRAALAAGTLAGAGLDVLETEPPDPADPLLGDERVIITPHIAFYSAESLVELKRRVAGAIIEALARRRQPADPARPGTAGGIPAGGLPPDGLSL